MQMRNLKQEAGSKNCVAVVAAMAFDCEVKEFEDFIGKSGEGYKDSDFARFAIHKNFMIGMPFSFIEDIDDELVCRISIHDAPAYLVVQSENHENKKHAVYWDGKNVWDPNPTAADNRPLSDYQIYFWYPILKLIEK